MSKILKGRALSRGIVEGEAIITKQPFSISAAFAFPLISNAKKLKVADKTHELFKQDVKDKILIFPIPIGTTTLGFVLLETIIRKISPKAIVCSEGEPLMSSGAVAADIFFNIQCVLNVFCLVWRSRESGNSCKQDLLEPILIF